MKTIVGILLLLTSFLVHADFALSVSPPRFELKAKPGVRVMEVVGIYNEGQDAAFMVKTADWTFSKDAHVEFFDELLPGSCRPWVAIEKEEVVVKRGRRVGYRVQIDVPSDAKPQECRFALMIEGAEEKTLLMGGATMPVTGRIAVIFYLAVGDIAADLSIIGTPIMMLNGARVPAITFKNNGQAHGRVSGFLSGKDADGQDLYFEPSTFPIMPGESRNISLTPVTRRKEIGVVRFPVMISGHLEWDKIRIPFEKKFD